MKGPDGEDQAFHIEIGVADEVIWRLLQVFSIQSKISISNLNTIYSVLTSCVDILKAVFRWGVVNGEIQNKEVLSFQRKVSTSLALSINIT